MAFGVFAGKGAVVRLEKVRSAKPQFLLLLTSAIAGLQARARSVASHRKAAA